MIRERMDNHQFQLLLQFGFTYGYIECTNINLFITIMLFVIEVTTKLVLNVLPIFGFWYTIF